MFLSKGRTRFIAGRRPLSDEEFVNRLGATLPESKYLLAVRNVIAAACGVDHELIYNSDNTWALDDIMEFDIAGGWDYVIFTIFLEEELKMPISEKLRFPSFTGRRCFVWLERPPKDFGTWALEVARRLADFKGSKEESLHCRVRDNETDYPGYGI
jgi:hypothetical protein